MPCFTHKMIIKSSRKKTNFNEIKFKNGRHLAYTERCGALKNEYKRTKIQMWNGKSKKFANCQIQPTA